MMSKSHSSQPSSSRASTPQFKKQGFVASKPSSHSPKYSSSITKTRTQQPYGSLTGHDSSYGSSTTEYRNSSFGSPTGQFSTQSHISPSAASCGSSTAWSFEDQPYGSSTAPSLTQTYGSPATQSWTPSYGSAAPSYVQPTIKSPPHSTWSPVNMIKNTASSMASIFKPSSDPEKKRDLRRKERLRRKAENQQKLTEIYTRYEKALMKRSEAQEQWQQVDQDIVDLDDRISESIERGEATQEVVEEAGHKWKGQYTQNQLYQDCKRELESLEEAKKAKSAKLAQAEDEFKEAESAYEINRTAKKLIKRRNDARATVDEIKREINDVEKREKEENDKLSTFQDSPTQQTQFTEDSSALVKGQQGPAQLKQDLENLRVEKERLTTVLMKAETEENKVRAEKEDFEKNVQQMEQLDRQQDTYIMLWLRDNLTPDDVDDLKSVLRNKEILTRHEKSTISSSKGLWQNLVDKQYISVGNYAALRKDIEDISMKKLAAEITEMEDDLLRPYDEQAKTLGDLHDAQYDTFTKRLDRHFKSIKEDDKAYKEYGGPFRYLKHVMTVAKHYLGELEEKSQSSKALQKFFDEKLKKNEILAVANTHAEEHKSGTAKSEALAESLKQANSEIHRLKSEKTKLATAYGKDISKLKSEKTKAEKATKDEKEKIEQIKKEYNDKEGKAKKDWEKWKKELEEENTKLRIERHSTDRKFREILDLMDGFKQFEVERFEEKERGKDIIRAEEVRKDKLTIQQMEGKLDEERDARRSMNDDNMRKRQKSYEDYGNKLIAFGERAMESETKIREKAREELMNVQAECGDNMLSRSKELMALRRELLEANLTNMFDKYEIGEREKKIKNLERKLALANARIQKFQDGGRK